MDRIAIDGASAPHPGLSVNGVQTGGAAIQWLGDNRTLIVSTVPGARGPAPSSLDP